MYSNSTTHERKRIYKAVLTKITVPSFRCLPTQANTFKMVPTLTAVTLDHPGVV